MSLWSRLMEWLEGDHDDPARVPRVETFPEFQLRKLWAERNELTEVAREAVRAECLKRGLKLRGLQPLEPAPTEPIGPPVEGNVVDARPGVGVLLQTTPGRFVLVMLPRWNPAPPELPRGLALDALIVCNHEPLGWLEASAMAEANGLSPKDVWATAPGPIDRGPGWARGEAQLLSSRLAFGNLWVTRLAGLKEVLRATWRGAPVTAAIGPRLPEALVQAQPASSAYVGSLCAPTLPLWSSMLSAAHAASVMAAVSPGPHGRVPAIILCADAVGTPLKWHTHLLPGHGFSLIGRECPVAPESIALLGDVLTARWEELDPTATVGEVEDVMEHLLIDGRLDDARRLVDSALARLGSVVQRLNAILLSLGGEQELALAALERAQGDSFAPLISSAVHAARGDWPAAEAEARRGLAALPSEPHALYALARVLWLSGRGAEARQVVDEAPPFSLTGTQASDLSALLEREPGSARRPAMPHVAARALGLARSATDRESALKALQRALELDPDCAAAADALASTTSALPRSF